MLMKVYLLLGSRCNDLGSSFLTEAVRKLGAFTGKKAGSLGNYTTRSGKFNIFLVVQGWWD